MTLRSFGVLVLMGVGMIGSLVVAENAVTTPPAKKEMTKTATKEKTSTIGRRMITESATIEGKNAVLMNLGAGLTMLNGETGWSVNVGGVTKAADGVPLYVGADFGANVWNQNPFVASGFGTSATGLQFLPTAVYRFDVANANWFHPYLGMSMGPHVYLTNTNTSVFFEMLFRPGVECTLSRQVAINFEPKFGVLKSSMIFLPQVNVIFAHNTGF